VTHQNEKLNKTSTSKENDAQHPSIHNSYAPSSFANWEI
jgi:hypothetical protein